MKSNLNHNRIMNFKYWKTLNYREQYEYLLNKKLEEAELRILKYQNAVKDCVLKTDIEQTIKRVESIYDLQKDLSDILGIKCEF